MALSQYVEAFRLAVAMGDPEAALEIVQEAVAAGYNPHIFRKAL